MTLLDDLRALPIGQIVDLRLDVTASVQADDLTRILETGPAAALGEVGAGLSAVGAPGGLEAMLADLPASLEALLGQLSPGAFPILELAATVEDGLRIIGNLVGGLTGDPLVTRLLDAPLQGLATGAEAAASAYLDVAGDGFAEFADYLGRADAIVAGDADAILALALDALIPFAPDGLRTIRTSLDALLDGAASITLPDTRVDGLVLEFEAVAAAAEAGDAAALDRALRGVGEATAVASASIAADFERAAAALSALPVASLAGALDALTLGPVDEDSGILEFLDAWRVQIAHARTLMEGADADVLLAAIPQGLAYLREAAQTEIVAPMEIGLERVELFVRNLLADLPHRRLRAEITAALHAVAVAVDEADLGRFGRQAQEAVAGLGEQLSAGDLPGRVQAQLAEVSGAIDAALDGVEGALETLASTLTGAADAAAQALGSAADALESFKAMLDEVKALIDNLGIEQAGQEVVDRLRDLREQAEELLSGVSLPEPMRPLVESLVDQLEGFDIEEAVGQPLQDAVDALSVPPAVETAIKDALEAARDAVENLVPANLVAELTGELDAALAPIRAFDPAALVPELDELVAGAADTLASFDAAALIAPVQAPFTAVMDAFDELAPRRLLQPAIDAYDELMAGLGLPTPAEGATEAAGLIASTGETVGRAAATPAASLAPPGAELAPAGSPASAPPEPGEGEVRAGDIVRMIAWVPKRLREALAAMPDTGAGTVLAQLDALTAGLAGDLRRIGDVLREAGERLQAGLDAQLGRLAEAQLRAQVAVQAGFSAEGGGASVDVSATVDLLGSAGPGGLREQLQGARDGFDRAGSAQAAALGAAAGTLADAAAALESLRVSSAVGELDGLLAALDPEPIAAEIDALVLSALQRFPDLFEAVGPTLTAAGAELQAMIEEFNPAAQARRFLSVLGLLREELSLLDPRRLADELGEIHGALRDSLAAYDPAALAAPLTAAAQSAATQLQQLQPSALLGDLAPFAGVQARLDALDPAQLLAGVGDALETAGERLMALDPAALLAAVNELPDRIAAQILLVSDAVRDEIAALLRSLQFATTQARAEVSGEVSL